MDEAGRLPGFVRNPFGVLRRRWFSMIAVTLLAGAAGGFYVWQTYVPTYSAAATVLVSTQAIRGGFMPSAVEEGAFEKISAMVGETLSTRTLAGLIEEHGLYWWLRDKASLAEIAGRMRRDVYIGAQDSVNPLAHQETARVFTISYRSGNPEQAAAIANELAEIFVASGLEMRSDRFRVAQGAFEERKEEALAEVQRRERAVAAYRRANRSELSSDTGSLQKRITDLRAERNRLLSVYTEEHPALSNLGEELDGLSQRLQQAQAAISRLEDLQRDVEHARRRYEEIEDKTAEADLAARLDEAGAREVAAILDVAEPPGKPERTPNNMLMAVVVGAIGLGGLVGIGLELRDPVIVSPEDVSHDFGLPVLGTAPRIR